MLKQTGFSSNTVIDLNNDQQLLQFGRAMFRYEAGRPLPWSDAQILLGIQDGRTYASTNTWPASPGAPTPGPVVVNGQMSDSDVLALLQRLIVALAANRQAQATAASNGATTSTSTVQTQTAPPILSSIDKLFGGEALAGYKTMFGVIGYVTVEILKAVGVLGAATPAGQILTMLSLAFTALGGLSKVDRMTQALGTIVSNAK